MTQIALLLSLGFAAGLALVVSPFLWPHSNADGKTRAWRFKPRIRRFLDDCGLPRVAPGRFIGLSICLGLLGSAILALVSPVLTLAVCAGAVGTALPAIVARRRRRRRIRAMEDLWPNVVDALVSSLRSGAGVVVALGQLGETIPDPIGKSARVFANGCSTSGNIDEHLEALKADWANPAADRIIEALRVSRTVGGTQLTNVLRELARTLREELAVKREIEARHGWVRVAAGVGATAPWVVVALLATRPEAVDAYQSPAGVALIVGGLVLTVVAHRLMSRIGAVRPERRWFA